MLLVFGSVFVVDVQVMAYHFCSLQMVLVQFKASDVSLKVPATQTFL